MGIEQQRFGATAVSWINPHPDREHLALENRGCQAFEAYCPMVELM